MLYVHLFSSGPLDMVYSKYVYVGIVTLDEYSLSMTSFSFLQNKYY